MLNSESNIFSSSEYVNLRNLLKDPEKDSQELISLLEQKVLEHTKRIRESEEKYRSLINALTNIGFGIDIVSKDYNVLYQNRVLKKKFGDNRAETCFDKYMGAKDPCKFCQMQDTPKFNEVKRNELKAVDNRIYEIISAPYPNPDGTLDKALEVIVDITERKSVEQKLRESEEKYRVLTEQSLMGIFILQKGRFKYINQAVSDIIGYSVEEMLNWTEIDIAKTIYSQDIKKIMNRLKRSEEGDLDEFSSSTFRIITKNGKLKWIEEYNKKIIYQGEPASLVTLIDITTKIKSEEKLRESENKYRHLFFQLPISISIFNSKGNLVETNRHLTEKLSEYTGIDFVGKNYLDIIPYFKNADQLLRIFKERLRAMLKGENPGPLELLLITKNDKRFWLYWQSSRIEINNETFFQVIIQDVTKQKESEEKIKESEEKFRPMAEQSLMGIFIVQDGKFKYANQTFSKIIGYQLEEILKWTQSSIFRRVHPNDISIIEKPYRKNLQGDPIEMRASQFRIKHKNGSYIWLETFSKRIEYENSPATLTSIVDITEKIIARQKLKESEERYRNLYENSPNAIALLDLTGKIIDCNLATEKTFGYPIEDVLGRNYLELPFYSKSTINMLKERFHAITKGLEMEPQEFEVEKKDGSIAWIKTAISYFKIGEQNFFQAIIQDITEQKKAEQQLKESEENFRTIIEDSHLAITILQDDLVVYTNQRMADMFGYKREDMLKWTPKEYAKTVAEDSLEFVMEQAKKKQIGDPDIIAQYPIHSVKNSGEKFWVDNISTTIMYNGRPADLVSLIDTTAKREAEQKLKESEEQFRTLTEQSFLGIAIIQNDLVKYVNRQLAETFGYKIDEIMNWGPAGFINVIYPEDRQMIGEQVKKKQLGESDVIDKYEFRGIKKNGDMVWLEVFSKTIYYKGELADFVTIHEITDRIKAEQELIKLNQIKSELLRRTSHELKTPLVSIKGFSELLLEFHRDKLDALIISTLNEIKQGCLRLENLINDILKTAELESGVIDLNKSKENLSFLVRVCVNEIKGFSKLRNHIIKLDLPENLITQFEKEQIHQVISNLLNNAIKYTPPSGLIEIKSDIKDDFIILSIKDNGIGFTEEEKTRIFKQFGKVERYGQGLDIITEGSGFGLFISKKIMKLHGGDIWVESEGRNKGSTFYISLPLI